MQPEKKKYIFSWANIKLAIREFAKIYSSKPSFLSKKRVESGVGFIIAEWGMIYFLSENIKTIGITGFAVWASIQFFIAGYIINQIQKEKKEDQ